MLMTFTRFVCLGRGELFLQLLGLLVSSQTSEGLPVKLFDEHDTSRSGGQ